MKEHSLKYSTSLLENYKFSNVMHGGKYDKEGKINSFFLQLSPADDTSTNTSAAVGFLEDELLPWTKERIKDELYIQLVSLKLNGERKYEKQARELIYRVPIFHPTPYFMINNSDLSSKLIEELCSLDDTELDVVITDVLSWIYESINKRYFLLSIKRNGLSLWEIDY